MPTDDDRVEQTEAMFCENVQASGAWISGDGRVLEEVAAQLLGYASATLANKRSAGEAPPHYKVGGRITYRVTDLAQWVELHRYE